MELQTLRVDFGQLCELSEDSTQPELLSLIAAARSAAVTVTAPLASFWLVLRGGAEIESREGHFQLRAGDWIALERDSRPAVDADRDALIVGLLLPQALHNTLLQSAQVSLHTGRGHIERRELRRYLRLWRDCGAFERSGRVLEDVDAKQVMRLLRHIGELQHEFAALIDRCPGRSLRRKRQVFSRMQRARLFLEGNKDRVVRITELAELSNVSIWYFTKTFQVIYGEGPQAASARFRLQQASDLLRNSRLSVSEVGAACGFENNCSFSRAFRARFGAPPSTYRTI